MKKLFFALALIGFMITLSIPKQAYSVELEPGTYILKCADGTKHIVFCNDNSDAIAWNQILC